MQNPRAVKQRVGSNKLRVYLQEHAACVSSLMSVCSATCSDVNKDWTCKDKDQTYKDQDKDTTCKVKDKDLTHKDQDKDLTLVLKES